MLLLSTTVIPYPVLGGSNLYNSHAVQPDGLSCKTAIIVDEQNESDGVAAERAWLSVHYPGWILEEQGLGQCGAKPADIMMIKTTDGRIISVYFDISKFFGKWQGVLERI